MLIPGHSYHLAREIKSFGVKPRTYAKANSLVKLISLHDDACIVEGKERFPCKQIDLIDKLEDL